MMAEDLPSIITKAVKNTSKKLEYENAALKPSDKDGGREAFLQYDDGED